MAYFEYRGRLQWRVQIRRKGYPAVSKTFKKKADAVAWAREIECEMDRGIFISRAEAELYTLKECLERYIEEYLPRLKHPECEKRRIRHLQRHPLASRVMSSIHPRDIAEFRKDRERQGAKPNTIRLDFCLLSHLFNYARSDWGMECLSNPVQLTTKPKVGKGRERRLEEGVGGKKGEEERLLDAASPALRPIILFALATAMRKGEILSLEWKHVNLQDRYALLVDTKNTESRTVPLSNAALEILQRMQEQYEATVKENEDGNDTVFDMTADAIVQAVRAACKKAGIKDLHFHDLRHEAVSRLFEQTDLDIMEIRAITGHKTMQMLARYTHLRTSRLADRLAGMGRKGDSS